MYFTRFIFLFKFINIASGLSMEDIACILYDETMYEETFACPNDTTTEEFCIFSTNCSTALNETQDCIASFFYSSSFRKRSCDPPVSIVDETFDVKQDIAEPTDLEAWIHGLSSAFVLSWAGLLGCVLSPILNTTYHNQAMHLLISLGLGSLISTAIFQLIPQAHKLEGRIGYLWVAFYMVIGIWILYVVQSLISIIFKEQDDIVPSNDASNNYQEVPLKNVKDMTEGESRRIERKNKPKQITTPVVAWMIVLGDGLHNLIDGVSLGSAYTQSAHIGFAMTLAIACGEFPHELGEFAILLKSGLSVRSAAMYNYMSACTCFVGVVIGIILGELAWANLVFSFAAGVYMYVGLSQVIPQLSEMLEESIREGRKSACFTLLRENIGFFVGFSLVIYIANHEE